MKNNLRRSFLIGSLAALLIVITVSIALVLSANLQKNKHPEGKILFLHRQEIYGSSGYSYNLYLMDSNGNEIDDLGAFTGSPAWSQDGKYIAVGCSGDPSSICILDASTIHDFRKFPKYSTNKAVLAEKIVQITQKINLPLACQAAITADWGIQSISWSKAGDKLAVVCGNEMDRQHEVCILPLHGDGYCWQHDVSSDVMRAVFSPTEDRLAVSDYPAYGAKIYLVNPDGSNRVYLTEGWSPEWSPNGHQIAFIRWGDGTYWYENGTVHVNDNGPFRVGLAIINSDGTDFRWEYQTPEKNDGLQTTINFNCVDLGGACRLAWSPDGRYIAFSAGDNSSLSFGTFRLNLKTDEIVFLLDSNQMLGYNIELDWGP